MSQEILLVDDSPDDAEIFRLAAKEAGFPYSIRVADSGEAALDLVLKQRIAPLLILLDIKMPGIDGLEVLKRIRADPIYRNVVIVVLTGSSLEADRVAALDLGCNLFITKPSSYEEAVEVARRIRSLLP
jgi:CheY-like chemotaxis protein